jgi:hypothetical protein
MSESNVVVAERMEKRERPVSAGATMQDLLRSAIDRGQLDVAKDIMAMIREEREAQARMAFTAALADFKRDPPEILKAKQVRFTTSRGVTEYRHATLGAVCDAITKALAQHGLSHRWVTEQPQGRVRVTCVLTHSAGHSESVTLESAPDDSGGKNSIQQIASAVSYLERYTLLAITGVATHDMDDDGRGADGQKHECLSEQQVADLQALITEHGIGMPALLTRWKIAALSEILAINYGSVTEDVKAIAARRRERA